MKVVTGKLLFSLEVHYSVGKGATNVESLMQKQKYP